MKRLIPVSKWNKFHVWPSYSGLRNLIFKSKKNGFDKVIKKIGKTVLIDEEDFFLWIEEQNKKSKDLANKAGK